MIFLHEGGGSLQCKEEAAACGVYIKGGAGSADAALDERSGRGAEAVAGAGCRDDEPELLCFDAGGFEGACCCPDAHIGSGFIDGDMALSDADTLHDPFV